MCEKKKLHYDVFAKRSDYIPLIIKLEQTPSSITPYEAMFDPQGALEAQLERLQPLQGLQSDLVLMAESNFLECLVPSLFGAQPFVSAGGLLDCKAIYHDVEDLAQIEMPDLNGGLMPQAIAHLEYLRDHVPEGIVAQSSRMLSPLDCAIVLRGGDFFLDLVDEPELCARFLDVITETIIAVVHIFKKVLDEPMEEQITIRGLHYQGIRLTSDSVVNFSPQMIEEFYFPCLKKFKDAFGNVMLHYCCTPSPSGHVLPTLVKCDYVDAVDNWQGHETFFNCEADKLQEKISVCTDLPYDAVADFDTYIQDKPFFQVPRKSGRALTITTTVQSVAQGNELYAAWQKRFA